MRGMIGLGLVVLLALGACSKDGTPQGGATTPPGNASTSQSLVDAVTMVCATPDRAEADPKFANAEPANKASIMAEHLKEGVTNADVKAYVDGVTSNAIAGGDRVTKLKELVAKANLATCRLADLWSGAPQP